MKILIQNLKVNYSEMTSAVDRKSQGILQQNQIMNLRWKESKLFKKITNKKVVYGLKRLLKYSSETFLISKFLLLRYYNYFQKEFLEISSFLSSLVKTFAKSRFLIKNELFYINQIYWLFWKYRNTPLITL